MPPLKIRKRNGSSEEFSPERITAAIQKAIDATGSKTEKTAEELTGVVLEIIENGYQEDVTVEQIQDIVEDVLINNRMADVAKAYILYRQKHADIREKKSMIIENDELKLPLNAVAVLKKRYLLRDESGNARETPAEMFRRVAKTVARNERNRKMDEEFYKIMSNLEFLPNSPTLMNAGTDMGQLSACFVLPVQDSLNSIFDTIKHAGLIHQSGGGTGFDFSDLRPKGDIVRSTMGVSSGPVSFIRIFDMTTEVIKQGGKRRGANMGILSVSHPDIEEFVTCKTRPNFLSNFNLSVSVTDEFIERVKKDEMHELINPRNKEGVKKVKARDLFRMMVMSAWQSGDPGLIFMDEINRHNPTPHIGRITATNPCGEQPLLPYESCNLGSINLARMIMGKNSQMKIDWEKLKKTVHLAVRFLDNVIDINQYPLREIEEMTKRNRKIGLGVMGFAEMLILLGIRYDSEQAVKTAKDVMRFVTEESIRASEELAREKGVFPGFKGSLWEKTGRKVRNAALTTIAPTGSISIIAGCSSGIEPLFAVAFVREIMEGTTLLEVNPIFERIANEQGFYSEKLSSEIARTGSLQQIESVPKDIKELFRTALDMEPEWHVRIQAAFQEYTHNGVSKTVNLREDASMEDVEKVFLLAHELRCKGITVYRYGSKPHQVLYLGDRRTKSYTHTTTDYAGGCSTIDCMY